METRQHGFEQLREYLLITLGTLIGCASKADMLDKPVNRPSCLESTALGAAYLAGLAVGYWKNKDEVLENWDVDRTFYPTITPEERNSRLKGWAKAVKYAYDWAKEE